MCSLALARGWRNNRRRPRTDLTLFIGQRGEETRSGRGEGAHHSRPLSLWSARPLTHPTHLLATLALLLAEAPCLPRISFSRTGKVANRSERKKYKYAEGKGR